jgi:DNA repair ATPase RecN
MEQDDFGFFVFESLPTDYTVYPLLHEDNTTSWIAEYTPACYAFGSYSTYKEAVNAVKEHKRKKEEMHARIEEQKVKIEEIQKANSLDERYKDHPNNSAPVVKKKVKTL